MDRISKTERSAIMSRIRSRGNKRTEISFVSLLRREKITGWRRHLTIKLKQTKKSASDGTKFKSQVRPDFVFQKKKLAVFIDGCFWHGCPKCYRNPKSRKKFWSAKILRNKDRDSFQTRALRCVGWKVIRIWECALKPKAVHRLMRRLQLFFYAAS